MPLTPGPEDLGITTTLGGPASQVRPVGMSTTAAMPSLVQSLEGLVANSLSAHRESNNVTRDLLIMAERTSRYMGDMLDKAQTLSGIGEMSRPQRAGSGFGAAQPRGGTWDLEALEEMMPNDLLTSGLILPPGVAPITAAPPAAAPGSPPEAPTLPRSPSDARGARGRGDEQVEGRAAPPSNAGSRSGPPPRAGGAPSNATETQPRNWPEHGRNYSFAKLRQDAARGINRRISEWGQQEEQVLVDETGMPFVGEDGEALTRAAPRGADPTALAEVDPETGVVNAVESFGGRHAALMAVRNAAGSVASGRGGALGAFSSAVPKAAGAAGVVAAGYSLANQAADFAQDQRESNAQFQRILGGDNAEGFGERWRQNMFRLGNRWTQGIGGADSEALYQGAAEAFVTNRGMRNRFQDAGIDLIRGTGIDGREASRLLTLAADDGNKALGSFASAIQDVSEAAREAGVSAEDARQSFEQAYRQASQIVAGPTATNVAQAQVQTHLAAGPEYQGVDISGATFDRQSQLLAASSMGMSMVDMDATFMEGGADAEILFGQIGTANYQLAASLLLTQPQMREIQEAYVEGGNNISPGKARELAGKFMRERGFTTETVGGMLATAGIKGPPDVAFPFLIQALPDPAQSAENQAEERAGNRELLGERVNVTADDMGTAQAAFYEATGERATTGGGLVGGILGVSGINENYARWAQDNLPDHIRVMADSMGLSDEEAVALWEQGAPQAVMGQSLSLYTGNKVQDEIISRTLMTGQYDPLTGALASQEEELADSEFVLLDASGREQGRTDLKGLVEDHSEYVQAHPDRVRIVGGEQGGRTVQDFVGAYGGDESLDAELSVSDDERSALREGGGELIIGMDPAAQSILEKVFTFETLGYMETEAANGRVPGSASEVPVGQRSGG